MTYHLYKSSYGQCKCLWCGRRNPFECHVTHEMRLKLAAFHEEHGSRWKESLRRVWESGTNTDTELQQLRNTLGPRGLARIQTRLLKRYIDLNKEKSCTT